jgi:phage major head subunit gpT-like protein
MIINPANMQIFFTEVRATFWTAYGAAKPWWSQVASLMPSSTEIEQNGWPGMIPTLREWVGPRVVRNMMGKTYILPNLPFELTLDMDRFKIEDDTHGVYAPYMQWMGLQNAKWPDYMIADTLRLNLRNSWDGVAMYATNHPVGDDAGSTFSNQLSLALTPDNFQTARAAMMKFNSENGRPLGIYPDLLVVPPSLEITALNILNASFIAPQTIGGNTQVGANENMLKGVARLLVVPELESTAASSVFAGTTALTTGGPDPAKTWYLFDTSKPIRSHFFQQRDAPVFVPRTNLADPAVFDEHKFLFGSYARGNVGVSLPWLTLRSVGGTLP